MGCGNPKEKVEDNMMKTKIALIEVQMEKYKQLELLKNIDGGQIKQSPIPSYIDKNFANKQFLTKRNSNSTRDDILRKRRGRSRSVKIKRSLRINKNEQINEINGKNEDKKDNENNFGAKKNEDNFGENKKEDKNDNENNEGEDQNDEEFQEIKIKRRRYSQKKKRTTKFQI